MGGVTLGAGKVVHGGGIGGLPALDRFVDAILALPLMIDAVGQIPLAMATET